MSLKITSLNANGIRAAERKGLSSWLKDENPDIFCLQELKAQEEQIPAELKELGYHIALSVAEKKGYSGVATFSKIKPLSEFNTTGIDWMDNEGRVIVSEFEHFQLINLYTPSGSSGDHRQHFKERFMEEFPDWLASIKKKDLPQLIATDLNIAHTELDIHNPKSNKNNPGFLPEERDWLTVFLENGFTDLFRTIHEDEPDHYSWWSYRARARVSNKGWRIDYFLAEEELAEKMTSCEICSDVVLSDHAPLKLMLF